jgi:hypothetical protein
MSLVRSPARSVFFFLFYERTVFCYNKAKAGRFCYSEAKAGLEYRLDTCQQEEGEDPGEKSPGGCLALPKRKGGLLASLRATITGNLATSYGSS